MDRKLENQGTFGVSVTVVATDGTNSYTYSVDPELIVGPRNGG